MRLTADQVIAEIKVRKRMVDTFREVVASFVGERVTSEVLIACEYKVREAMIALSQDSYFETTLSCPSFHFNDAGDGNVTTVPHNDAAVWLLAMCE